MGRKCIQLGVNLSATSYSMQLTRYNALAILIATSASLLSFTIMTCSYVVKVSVKFCVY